MYGTGNRIVFIVFFLWWGGRCLLKVISIGLLWQAAVSAVAAAFARIVVYEF